MQKRWHFVASAHGLRGSQGSFLTGYFCRYCYSCYGKVSNTFLENQFCLRSIESFAEDINEALQSRGGRGVKHRFALYVLGYNNLCLSNMLLPDCLHDYLEGIVPEVLCVVLVTLKADKIITLSQINLLISAFKYKLNGTGLNPFWLKITETNIRAQHPKSGVC